MRINWNWFAGWNFDLIIKSRAGLTRHIAIRFDDPFLAEPRPESVIEKTSSDLGDGIPLEAAMQSQAEDAMMQSPLNLNYLRFFFVAQRAAKAAATAVNA
jgi:hypothetical protein